MTFSVNDIIVPSAGGAEYKVVSTFLDPRNEQPFLVVYRAAQPQGCFIISPEGYEKTPEKFVAGKKYSKTNTPYTIVVVAVSDEWAIGWDENNDPDQREQDRRYEWEEVA